MANSLLDFVMSLVRDPEAAARYAADPAQAIADAHLTDVTSADVENLIPVVSESLPMSSVSPGLDPFGGEVAGNVWASGAATAAFDAFADQVPELSGAGVIDTPSVVTEMIDETDPGLAALTGADFTDPVESLQLDVPIIDDALLPESGLADDWAQPVADPHSGDSTPGFDVFD